MKTKKAEIKQRLDELETFIASLSKATEALTAAQADAEKLERSIEKIGEPDYRDDDKITRLAFAKTKLELCEKQIARLDSAAAEAAKPYGQLLYDCGRVASAVLVEIAERRLETVTCTLLPFSGDRQSAQRVAEQTDTCRAGFSAARRYERLSSQPSHLGNPPALILHIANEIRDVLRESLRDAPDFMRFLPSSVNGASAQTTEASAADATSDLA